MSLAVSGDSARLYLNGRLQNDTRLPKPMTLEGLRNGGDLVLFDGFWGTVSRLRLHDYALSERQIRVMMHEDVPGTLVRYPLTELAGGVTPAIPRGDFPLDAWSWEARDFKPEGTFAAAAGDAELVERDGFKAVRFKDGHGVRVPARALRDMGLSRVTVSFWWRSEAGAGSLVHTPGHWNRGMNVNFRTDGFQGVVCANWQLPAVEVLVQTHAWHHMIVSYDNREFRLYHNGELLKRAFHIPDIRLSMVDGLVVGNTPGMMVRDLRITTTIPDEQALQSIRAARTAISPHHNLNP